MASQGAPKRIKRAPVNMSSGSYCLKEEVQASSEAWQPPPRSRVTSATSCGEAPSIVQLAIRILAFFSAIAGKFRGQDRGIKEDGLVTILAGHLLGGMEG